MKMKLGKWKKIIYELSVGTMAGIGFAAVLGKLPMVNNFANMGGFVGAYFVGGMPGLIGYGLASGTLGSLTSMFGTVTATAEGGF